MRKRIIVDNELNNILNCVDEILKSFRAIGLSGVSVDLDLPLKYFQLENDLYEFFADGKNSIPRVQEDMNRSIPRDMRLR